MKLQPVGDQLMFAQDREEFESFKVPKQAQYALVSPIDSISLLRDNVACIIEQHDMKFVPGGLSKSVLEIQSPIIVDRGRIVGLWEYDPEAEQIVSFCFVAKNKELTKAVERTGEYVRKQLGDARSFSLDSPKSRAPRIQALRKAAAR